MTDDTLTEEIRAILEQRGFDPDDLNPGGKDYSLLIVLVLFVSGKVKRETA